MKLPLQFAHLLAHVGGIIGIPSLQTVDQQKQFALALESQSDSIENLINALVRLPGAPMREYVQRMGGHELLIWAHNLRFSLKYNGPNRRQDFITLEIKAFAQARSTTNTPVATCLLEFDSELRPSIASSVNARKFYDDLSKKESINLARSVVCWLEEKELVRLPEPLTPKRVEVGVLATAGASA